MKDEQSIKLGATIAVIGIIVGLIGFAIFVVTYNPMIEVELDAGRPDEANVVRYVFPLLGYLLATATTLWALSLYGFVTRQRWAWMLGIIASTISLLSGFFPMIPAMSREETPYMVAVFFPNLALWVGLLFVRKVNWKIGTLAFVAGLAYIFTFMDGVAAIDKIQIVEDETIQGLYVMVQEVNWWATIAWAVFIFALLGRKTWAHPLGIGAALMACIGGYPIAVESTLDKGSFSLFAPAPLLSTALLIYLLRPATRQLLEKWTSSRDEDEGAGVVSQPAYAGK